MAKPKTIAAIEPNAGLRAALQKKIAKLVRARTRAAAAELFEDLIASGLVGEESRLAQDAKPTVKDFKAVDLEKASKHADTAYAERLARWMIHTGEDAKAVSKWFVRTTAQRITASQRRALILSLIHISEPTRP